MKPQVVVVAAILADAEGRVLVAQRPPGKELAGYWEFPGGKLEPGEGEVAALSRELHEELGVGVEACEPYMALEHDYDGPHGGRRVRLLAWRVTRWQGEPTGREGQALQWLPPSALMAAGLLPADAPIAQRLADELMNHP
jgi:8-oxo-dGTP diphosphatase